MVEKAPSEAVARAAREQPYVKLASNLHEYCSYMTGFSTYFGRAWPERPVSAAHKSGKHNPTPQGLRNPFAHAASGGSRSGPAGVGQAAPAEWGAITDSPKAARPSAVSRK